MQRGSALQAAPDRQGRRRTELAAPTLLQLLLGVQGV